MDVRDRAQEVLVLRSRAYREQDKLLTLVSAAEGPMQVIAKGAGKPGSPLRPLCQTMSRAQVLLSPEKGGISFLKGGVPEESYLSATDLDRFAYGAYCSELMLLAWPGGKAAPELYALLLATFSLLKLDDDLPRSARFFELRLLDMLGLLPDLRCCSGCGCSRNQGGQMQFLLSPYRGGLLCQGCAGEEAGPRLSAGSCATMERLLTLPLTKLPGLKMSRAVAAELEAACGWYLAYVLPGADKAKEKMRQLL